MGQGGHTYLKRASQEPWRRELPSHRSVRIHDWLCA